MTKHFLILYVAIGFVTAPFFMHFFRLGRRQRLPIVTLIWLLLALIWPFALFEFYLFHDERPR